MTCSDLEQCIFGVTLAFSILQQENETCRVFVNHSDDDSCYFCDGAELIFLYLDLYAKVKALTICDLITDTERKAVGRVAASQLQGP